MTAADSYVEYWNKFVAKVSVSQISVGLDAFYKDFRNRNIEISDGVWVVLNQIAGKTENEIQYLSEALRQNVRPKGQ